MKEVGAPEVRQYHLGDEVQIVSLLRIPWPNEGRNAPLDHWRWKHQNSSFQKSIVVVAENGGRIIGCDHCLILNMKVGDGVFTSSIGTDVTVHPDFRNKGIRNSMRKVSLMLNEQSSVKFLFGYAVNPLIIQHPTKVGTRQRSTFPFQVKNLLWIGDIDLHFRINPRRTSFVLKCGFKILRSVNRKIRNLRRERQREGLLISEISSFDAKIDDFWREVSTQYNFIIERKQDYLNWRHSTHMIGEHTIQLAEENGKIVGYCILSIDRQNKNYPFGHIEDLLVLPDRLCVVDSLLAEAIRYFINNGVNISSAQVVSGNPYLKIFRRWGFVGTKTEVHIYFNYRDGIEKNIEKFATGPASRVHVCHSDLI